MLFQLAGVIISHAFSQKSSICFPHLALHIYSHIIGEEVDKTRSKMKKQHLDATTALLHDFINSLENCKSDDDIHHLLEANSKCKMSWQIVNASQWSKEKVINIKSNILWHLASHELVASRRNKIDEFSDGLESLSILNLVCKNETCKHVLMEMITEVEARSFSEHQADSWFTSCINQKVDDEFLNDSWQQALLQFWTGWTVVSFGRLRKSLKFAFLPHHDAKSLPTTSSCAAV